MPSISDLPNRRDTVVLPLKIKDAQTLHAAFIRPFKHGGLFVPTTRTLALGETVVVALTLPSEAENLTVKGTVAWITPAQAGFNRAQGLGIAFDNEEQSARVVLHIEALLSNISTKMGSTHTF